MKTTKKIMMLAVAAMLMGSCAKKKFMNEPGTMVPKTVDQDHRLPSIRVNGALLHAEAWGPADSTIIIGLHSGPGGDYRSLLNCKELADHGFRVVLFDQRGSGLSQRFPHDFYAAQGTAAIDQLYDDLSGVIAHYKKRPGQKVILLGQSWGGILATGYTGRYPERIHGLAVCEPGGLKWEDIANYSKASRSFKLTSEELNDATYMDQNITGKKDDHEILDYKLMMVAGDNSVTGEINSAPQSNWRLGAVVLDALFRIDLKHEPDFSVGIENYKKPVLFFYSEKNTAYGQTWAEKVSSSFPSVQLHYVAGTGHTGVMSEYSFWCSVTKPRLLTYFNSIK